MLLWAYNQMVLPILSYCSFVWQPYLKTKQLEAIQGVQRLALLMTGNYRKGTHTASLENILGVLPIDLHLKKHVFKLPPD